MEGVRIGYSSQYRTNCVIITKQGLSPVEVIEYAQEHYAVFNNADGDQFVIDFQIPGDERRVGPELYSYRALRSSL